MKSLRGAYFNDEYGISVMISKKLPEDPMVFTMAHELKHHLVDSSRGIVNCIDKSVAEPIEIGAEIFAAEFLFPEEIFKEHMDSMNVGKGQCTQETLVKIKHETKTTLSYAGLVKKAEWLEFAVKGSIPQKGWKSLEEKIYGVPFYKRRRARP
jgi:Zn-dependent peptidase ImmA (M78 family)